VPGHPEEAAPPRLSDISAQSQDFSGGQGAERRAINIRDRENEEKRRYTNR